MSRGLGADRIRMVDSRGEVLHQWGTHEPGFSARPAAELQLAPPLAAWRLQYFPAEAELEASLTRRLTLQLFIGLFALGLVLVGLAAYFYRESSRELRDARQRVTFVNQVSHELKTPLTNIRMYAELLQKDLGAETTESVEPGEHEAENAAAVVSHEARLRDHAGVIVEESHRLSRLIANILTFGRKQRDVLRLHMRPGVVDETIAAVLEVFPAELRARRREVLIDLSLRDVKILELLHAHRGKVLDRNTLFNHCWGIDYFPNSRTLDQQISQLRKRIEVDPRSPRIIRTVHGAGYRYDG